MPAADLLTAREAAACLGFNERTIRRAIARGDLPATKRRGVYRIPRSAVARFQARDRTPTKPTAPTVKAPPPVVPLPPLDHASPPSLSLPLPLTSFVGRKHEVAEVGALLRGGARLVTLTGPGGVGKTRLALAVASALANEFPDGVHFVSFASVSDPSHVPSTVARALGVQDVRSSDLLDRLSAVLRGRALLLVLDNLEHLLPAAPWVVHMLQHCAGVNAIVTSRERLRVTGEREYPVHPLVLPAHGLASADAMAAPAVQLFVDRARVAAPNVELNTDHAETVAQICRRLDGLPLAIELAAARVKVIPVADLLARQEKRLPLLTGGPRDAPGRLQTMRDAIAWSHDLLTAEEQVVFRRLSVFAGSFSLEAAEEVMKPEPRIARTGDKRSINGEQTLATVNLVASLVDQNLLRTVPAAASESRFQMLETIREFGLERLAATGEEDSIHRQLASWCLAMADRVEPELYGGRGQIHAFDLLDRERFNLNTALTWV